MDPRSNFDTESKPRSKNWTEVQYYGLRVWLLFCLSFRLEAVIPWSAALSPLLKHVARAKRSGQKKF